MNTSQAVECEKLNDAAMYLLTIICLHMRVLVPGVVYIPQVDVEVWTMERSVLHQLLADLKLMVKIAV